jgi:hypothetical protein
VKYKIKEAIAQIRSESVSVDEAFEKVVEMFIGDLYETTLSVSQCGTEFTMEYGDAYEFGETPAKALSNVLHKFDVLVERYRDCD